MDAAVREGGTPRNAPVVPVERLDAAVDELLALGRERGERLRRARSEPPSPAARDKADIDYLLRLKLKTELSEVADYTDEQLVELAWEALAALQVPDEVRHIVVGDLTDAEKQLRDPLLAAQGRGRLRRFVFRARSG